LEKEKLSNNEIVSSEIDFQYCKEISEFSNFILSKNIIHLQSAEIYVRDLRKLYYC
jgi:hypothetical protein